MARVLIHVPFLLACRLPVSSPKSKKILEEVTMSTVAIVTIAFFALGIIVAIGVGVWLYASNRRTKQLRAKFGPEYNRIARAERDTGRAEELLHEREKRVQKLDIKPLTDPQRNDF